MSKVILKNGKTIIVCKASQKCEDCKAFVDRFETKNTEAGDDWDEWQECAFGYVKEDNYLRYLEFIKKEETK